MKIDAAMLCKAVPNALTLGNGTCGIGGLVVLSGLEPDKARTAAALIFAGWLFDMSDGIAARRLGTSGAFGAALDSICDAVTFGALPAVLIANSHPDAWTLAAAFAFGCGALLRLARYIAHATPHDGPRWFFDGLPSPAAAMMIATAVLLRFPAWQIAALALIAAAAMVSRLPYADLPRFYFSRRWPWATAVVAVIAGIVLGGGPVVATILGLYLLSGPAVHVARSRRVAA